LINPLYYKMQHVKISVITSLYRPAQFLADYLKHVSKIVNLEECEFILVHNDPAEKELEILQKFDRTGINIVHLIVERENLYSSWNRAIKVARGQYITVWNVDDIRFPDSLLRQAQALEKNPEAAISYGDIYGTNEYQQKWERFYQFPEWESQKEEFWRSHLVNCFQMWRKSIHQSVGYYDEQFRSSGDFDFQIRTAMRYPLVKVEQPLGVYLENQPHKISSSSSTQILENNIVYLRYGVFEKIQFQLLPKAVAVYNKDQFLYQGQWVENREKTPFSYLYRVKGVFIGMVRLPKYLAIMFRDRFLR
jgi:GT2 family glycosyltransferase